MKANGSGGNTWHSNHAMAMMMARQNANRHGVPYHVWKWGAFYRIGRTKPDELVVGPVDTAVPEARR